MRSAPFCVYSSTAAMTAERVIGPRISPGIPNSLRPAYMTSKVTRGEAPACFPRKRGSSTDRQIETSTQMMISPPPVHSCPRASISTAQGTRKMPEPKKGRASARAMTTASVQPPGM